MTSSGTMLLAAAVFAVAPAAAQAKSGFMTCQATDTRNNSVYTTPTEFVADSGDEAKALNAYIKLLQAGVVPLVRADLSTVQGICHWEEKKGAAMRMTTNYLIRYVQLGYLANTETKMPDPFVP